MSKLFKKLFKSNVIKCSEVADELIKLIREESDKKLAVLNLTNTRESDFDFILNCSYFFSYLLATRNNDININSAAIENITHNFATYIVDYYIKQYNLKGDTDEYLNKLYKETKALINFYENSNEKRKLNSIKKVAKKLIAPLEDNNSTKSDLLSNLIIHNMTLSQDYLLNISRRYSLAN
ncbi:hypothetical protein BX659_10497 [Orenia metallireducens]|jgi:hypothetical protein|uniref:Uncharacterized protein n=1 Tax=Orenia metallireducens TaxID=1413210 RepID=A0A285GBD9_9FIRM|nr:hypothetical protein [Orenia metallireducens]PRX32548.1 hypothetical protein BX659_10497 [Orenia metallireducens]SNY20887.1 hypothetical protein SAMN06265827_10651 [Orenia metallireducens]